MLLSCISALRLSAFKRDMVPEDTAAPFQLASYRRDGPRLTSVLPCDCPNIPCKIGGSGASSNNHLRNVPHTNANLTNLHAFKHAPRSIVRLSVTVHMSTTQCRPGRLRVCEAPTTCILHCQPRRMKLRWKRSRIKAWPCSIDHHGDETNGCVLRSDMPSLFATSSFTSSDSSLIFRNGLDDLFVLSLEG